MALEDQLNPVSPDPKSLELTALVASLVERVSELERTVAMLSLPYQPEADEIASLTPEPMRYMARPVPPPPLVVVEHSSGKTDGAAPAAQRSLEDRLGSQIFNRIAIVAILIGATLFLKLAMDNHWIGPLGRVIVGLIAGIGLVAWSERFRRREFAAFSYSLKAVGSGVLYLSLWASFQLYHLIPSEAAFGLMVLITSWNAWMAWAQDSELLAAYAIAGGFATPLLLSTGGNHQVFLFSYIFTIDLATIALVRFEKAKERSWSRLLLGALPATIAYFISWFSSFYTAEQLASTSLFIALFFLVFLTVPLRLPFTRDEETTARPAEAISDILLPLANAVFASLAFYAVLEDSGNHAALPWVSLVFAAIYLSVMRLAPLARSQTAAARAVHLSLAVLFLTIAIPLKASGRWITIGWLAEGVALLWVSSYLAQSDRAEADAGSPSASAGASVHRMLRRLASLALTLGFVGLFVLPFWLDRSVRTAFFNQRFATELAGILALAAVIWISQRALVAEKDRSLQSPAVLPEWLQLGAASTVALNLIALQAGINEIETFWQQAAGSAASLESGLQIALSISAFLMLYGAAVLAIGFWKRSAFLRWQGLVLLMVAILKTFLYDVRSLSQGYRVVSFLGLGALLMAVSFAYVQRTSRNSGQQ